jgi:regulator of cell morphogenesis and NO signaling
MEIGANSRVGEVAAQYPSSTKVFYRHGIDFCCGGGREIQDACTRKGVDVDNVLAEIETELTTATTTERWDIAPLEHLIKHILVTFHAPLKEELPRLHAMAEKVNSVHGARDPERLAELVTVIQGLKDELEEHMMKEEQVLFPMILGGNGAMAQGPVSVMEEEHESAGAALRRIRELTDNYTVPEGACTTWNVLWDGLEKLEEGTHQHIHLENNILFPRALAN